MRPLPLLSLVRLFARGVRAAPWRRLSDRAKVGGLALTSIGTSELPRLALVGDIVFLSLVFYATYLLAKPAVSKLFANLADDIGLRLILALSAAAIVHGATWNANTGTISMHRPFIVLAVVGTPILLDVYLSRTDTPRPYPFAYGRQIFRLHGESQERIAADQQRLEVIDENSALPFKTLLSYENRVIIVFLLSIPFWMWGGLVVVFEGFYPALELALLGGAALGPIIARRSPRFDDESEVLAAIDTEEQSSRALITKNIFHPKWMGSVALIATNIFVTIVLFLFGIAGIFLLVEHAAAFAQQPSPGSALKFVVLIAFISTLLTFSLYALWFWRVELARLPAFLSHWRDVYIHPETDSSAATEPPGKTRPPWGMLPPAILLLVTALFFGVAREVQSNSTALRLVGIVYIVLWTLGVLFVGWTVVQWYRRDPQPIRNESRVLVGNCIVQTIPLVVFFGVARELNGHSRLVSLVLGTVSMIVIFYFVDAVWILKNKYGQASALQWIPMLGLITFIVVVKYYFAPELPRIIIYSMVALVLVGATMHKAQIWLANKHAPREDFLPDDTTVSAEPDERPTSE